VISGSGVGNWEKRGPRLVGKTAMGRAGSARRHARTPRQCECTRLIAAAQVKQTIRRIPDVGAPSRAKAGPRRPASVRQDVRA